MTNCFYIYKGKFRRNIMAVGARDYIDRNWWAYVYDIYRRWQLPRPHERVIKGVLTELQNVYYNG